MWKLVFWLLLSSSAFQHTAPQAFLFEPVPNGEAVLLTSKEKEQII